MLGTNGPVSSDSEQNSLINGPRNPLGKCACRYPLSFQAARFLPSYHHHLHMFLEHQSIPHVRKNSMSRDRALRGESCDDEIDLEFRERGALKIYLGNLWISRRQVR
jgi:hypothetical protein